MLKIVKDNYKSFPNCLGPGRRCRHHSDGQEPSGPAGSGPFRLHVRRVRERQVRRDDDRPSCESTLKI